MNEIKVKLVKAEQTWDLRHRVLRPGHKTYTPNPEDQFPTTFHVAAFIENQVVGVASFQIENHPELPAKNTYRLRGMATDQNYREKGIGAQVFNFGVAELKKKNCDLLWFNAREVAFPFYERMHCQFLGDMFDMPGIGPHKVMFRYLKP